MRTARFNGHFGRGVSTQGVSAQRRGVCLGGVHPPVNRMSDRCKNITFPQLRFRAVIINCEHIYIYKVTVKIIFKLTEYLAEIIINKIELVWSIKEFVAVLKLQVYIFVAEITFVIATNWHWLIIPCLPLFPSFPSLTSELISKLITTDSTELRWFNLGGKHDKQWPAYVCGDHTS